MEKELKRLNLRLFYLLRRISFKNEKDRAEAAALQMEYEKLADSMSVELFDLFDSKRFELLS